MKPFAGAERRRLSFRADAARRDRREARSRAATSNERGRRSDGAAGRASLYFYRRRRRKRDLEAQRARGGGAGGSIRGDGGIDGRRPRRRLVVLNNVVISARPHDPDDLCLCLTAARIGGRLEIARKLPAPPSRLRGRIRLDRAEVDTIVTLHDVELGSKKVQPTEHCLDIRVLRARHLSFNKVVPIGAAKPPSRRPASLPELSVTVENARLERLSILDSQLTGGSTGRLCGGGNVTFRNGRRSGELGRIDDRRPRSTFPAEHKPETRALLSPEAGRIGRAAEAGQGQTGARPCFEKSPATVDLGGLSCDTRSTTISAAHGGATRASS